MKNLKLVLLIIGGIVLFLAGGVVAATLSAKDIGFTSSNEEWNVDNVEDAMNDLYKIEKSVISDIGLDYLHIALTGNHKYYKYHEVTSANGFTYEGTNFILEEGKYLLYLDNGGFGFGIATTSSNGTTTGTGTNTPIEYEVVKTLFKYGSTTGGRNRSLALININEEIEGKVFVNGYSGGRDYDSDFILIKL